MVTAQVPAEGEFSGKRILVTGASGAIGGATARILAESGAHVVLNGRDTEKLEKMAATLPASAHEIAPFDLAKGDEIPNWFRGLAEKNGPFAGIAHIAGMQKTVPLRVLNTDFININFHVNAASALMLGKAFRQKGCHADGASLTLLSSTASGNGGSGNTAYSASKAALHSITRSMAKELNRDRIRVNSVISGLIETKMWEQARRQVSTERLNTILSAYPIGFGKPTDVAYAMIYLLSERSKWVTGIDLLIDGGMTIV